jgi:aspartyl aminopeptidase
MSESKYEAQRKALMYKPQNGYDVISDGDKQEMSAYCRRYMDFLDAAKTEREAVRETIRQAEQAGFVAYQPGMALTPGTKVYQENHGKAINLAVIGKRSLAEGSRIAAAHIDNPRLDLKPNPLYEDDQMAFFKTHYYGGIKKYQWTTVPMALHGVVVKRDGTVVDICIGEKDDDPVFIVTDLLVHLAEAQMKKPLATGVTGENLNVLVGSIPLPEEGSDAVKLAILIYLNETYGITEEDLLSAELIMVPAAKARELGFDRSLIAAFGHDDRSCSFAALDAMLALEEIPEYTAVCCLADKEEIGSMGISGMESQAFEYFMDCLCSAQGVKLMECFRNSQCLSADVTNAFDPTYPEVCDKQNNAHINGGVCFMKYTGSRGKSGSSDAPAEFVAKIRRLCAEGEVVWQTGELGKVDAGGGGTVAQYMANRNILTLDTGVPVLSMHAPVEVVSKLDCYMTRKAMKVFYQDQGLS